MIKMENITKQYGIDKIAVDNLNINLEQGSICGFIGHNGAGKTTTLKMLTGLIKPTKGTILINGENFSTDNLNIKKKIAYVPDKPMYLLELTGAEYLNFILDLYDINELNRENDINDLIVKFKMKNNLNQKIESYSHGMRKKIMIIGAFLSNAKILILDEPLTGLDPEAIFILKDMIKEYSKNGNIIIFSTHLLDIAQELCTEFIILNKGVVKFSGNYKKIQELYDTEISLEDVFMEIIKNG